MAKKSTDIPKGESEDDSLPGASRFAVSGMFRGKRGDNEKTDTKVEDEAGFFKNVSKRLTFWRESDTANGVEDKRKKSAGMLRMVGKGARKSGEPRDAAKQLAMLQKEKEQNRKRQLIIAKQKGRNEQKEKEIQKEEKRIADLIARAEAEQKREEELRQKELAKLEIARQREAAKKKLEDSKQQQEEEQRRKEEAKLEAERKRDEARKQKKERDRQKVSAADTEKEQKKGKTPSNAAAKFFSNIWSTGTSAFSGNKVVEEWVPLIPKTRIEPGEIVPVQIQGIDLLVVASRDGKVHCLANACSHMGTPLDTGRLESRPKQDASGKSILTNTTPPKVECEDCITCPLHHTAFSLETGEVRGDWCPYPPVIGPAMGKVKETSPVATFDIRTRGKNIEVRFNSPVE